MILSLLSTFIIANENSSTNIESLSALRLICRENTVGQEKILSILSLSQPLIEGKGEEDVLLDDTSSNNQRSSAHVSTEAHCGRALQE